MSEPLGKPVHITMHWSACANEAETFSDYHFNVNGNSGAVVQTLSVYTKGAHTWMRNSGNLGLAFDAPGPGACQVVAIEAMAKLAAELCCRFGLDPRGAVTLPAYEREGIPDGAGDCLMPTGWTVNAPVIADHALFAKFDQYSAARWDIGSQLGDDPRNLYALVLPKARWYFDQLKAGKCHFEHTVNLH
jgi:hypothetical protein